MNLQLFIITNFVLEPFILANDIHPGSIELAIRSAALAGVHRMIRFSCRDVEDLPEIFDAPSNGNSFCFFIVCEPANILLNIFIIHSTIDSTVRINNENNKLSIFFGALKFSIFLILILFLLFALMKKGFNLFE